MLRLRGHPINTNVIIKLLSNIAINYHVLYEILVDHRLGEIPPTYVTIQQPQSYYVVYYIILLCNILGISRLLFSGQLSP